MCHLDMYGCARALANVGLGDALPLHPELDLIVRRRNLRLCRESRLILFILGCGETARTHIAHILDIIPPNCADVAVLAISKEYVIGHKPVDADPTVATPPRPRKRQAVDCDDSSNLEAHFLLWNVCATHGLDYGAIANGNVANHLNNLNPSSLVCAVDAFDAYLHVHGASDTQNAATEFHRIVLSQCKA